MRPRHVSRPRLRYPRRTNESLWAIGHELRNRQARIGRRHPGAAALYLRQPAARAHLGFPDNPAYQASKAAVAQLTRAMAIDFGSWGVRVNSLCPGYVATAMTRASYEDADARRARAARTILGRWADPEDLVGPCQFLLSEASAYVTGTELVVDGGWLAKGL
jgi:NAD(P)-dependent dehydrogenase (short-subunit alcohol dehydrogenase family)